MTIDMDHVPHGGGQAKSGAQILFARNSAVAPFLDFLRHAGAPAERWLSQAGIPVARLDDPGGLVALTSCYRFLELVARKEHLPEIGVRVGQRTSAFELGAFGANLAQVETVYDYLRTAIRNVRSQNSAGTMFWLGEEGDYLRVFQALSGARGLGPAIADVYSLVLTINTFREMIGPQWCPGEIRLRSGGEYLLGDWDLPQQTVQITGQRVTSFTLPRALLAHPVSAAVRNRQRRRCAGEGPPMPVSFPESVQALIASLLLEGVADLHSVADAAGTSPRSLQRRLAEHGCSHRGLLAACRMRLARERLAGGDMPVAEIAAELGYTDASNFARAFHREHAMSPLEYRRARTRD